MIEKSDFILRQGTENGYTIVREMSCGFAPFLPNIGSYWMVSKKGGEGSFSFPKGHVQIVDGFPETMIETADRETREEMGLEESLQLAFNGFMGSIKQRQDFEGSRERSFKTITYLGATVADIAKPDLTLPNGRIVRAISLDDARIYARPELHPVVDAYQCFLKRV